MVSVLTINIGAAAPARAAVILEWLKSRSEDVFVLTETSPGLGTKLIFEYFQQMGYTIACSPFAGRERGVAIVSRLPASQDVSSDFSRVSIPERVAAIRLATTPEITIMGLYVPSRNQTAEKVAKKQLYIDTLLQSIDTLPERMLRNYIICGDYNVIGRDHVPSYRKFLGFEYEFLDGILSRDFVDAFSYLHPAKHEYSWVGRTGDGYRYDYFHIGANLQDYVAKCEYIHHVRSEQKITDHSALTLELKLES